MGTAVGNDLIGQTMQFPNVVSVESGGAKSGCFIVGRNEMSTLGEMVVNDKDRIVAEAFREMSDKVGGNTFPRGIRDRDGDQFPRRGFREGFGSGAEVAFSHVFSDKSVHAGPPVVA